MLSPDELLVSVYDDPKTVPDGGDQPRIPLFWQCHCIYAATVPQLGGTRSYLYVWSISVNSSSKQDPGFCCDERWVRTSAQRCSRRLNWGRSRSSMRIYLYVYIFSPLSICTLGDNIQSRNGKKREGSRAALILPSFLRHMGKKIVCCTCDSERVLFCISLLPPPPLIWPIHSAPEEKNENIE